MIDEKIFKLSPEGLSLSERKKALNEYIGHVDKQSKHFLGYQNVQTLNYEDDIKEFLNFHINNIGDPFVSGNYTPNSKAIERAVLDYYAKLWNAKTPHDFKDPESYWGYSLTMGSTEGNLYGIWNARDYLSGKKLLIDNGNEHKNGKHRTKYIHALPLQGNPNAYRPVAFFSEDTHYSIIKAMRVLQIPTFYDIGKNFYPRQNPLSLTGEWTKEFFEVPSSDGSKGTGAIDVEKLAVLVEFFAAKGYPILVVCNYGTTFKGAYDDVQAIGEKLMPIFEKYGLVNREVIYDEEGHSDVRNGYWIHVDGALGASYMPFLEMAYNRGEIAERGPIFDFRLPYVNSIVTSGHKWVGTPWPSGIFMTKVKYQLIPPDAPEYIGSPDTTFAGSRNGLSPVIMWDFLAQNSYRNLIDRAVRCENLANYAEEQLKTVQECHSELDLFIERTPLSLTVRFRKPNGRIVYKHSLSCETLLINDEERHYAHIFTMDSVTKERIDEFISELKEPDAFEAEKISAKIKQKTTRKAAFLSERERGWR